MQIIEISEAGSSNQHEHDKHIGVGIDFGTTNSLIAFSNNQKPQIIADDKGIELLPSTIAFSEGNFIIGDNDLVPNLRSIKRFFGKTLTDIKGNSTLFALAKDYIDLNSEILRIKFNEKLLTVPEIAAQIFLHLKKQAEKTFESKIIKAVVTVPAHFDDIARGEVMLAAKIAGFEVLRLIAEPTAAAYAYGLNKKNIGCYLVYDLGGGTFDVSILNMQLGILQVISTGGDNLLGGDDIDHLVMNYFCNKYNLLYSLELMKLAKKVKETLSNQPKFSSIYNKRILELNIEEFEKLIFPLVRRTLMITKDTLDNAGNPDIAGIILVGGSTRIPLISHSLKQTFNTTIFSDIDPDKAVVWGAALQAENLTSTNVSSLLIDVVPLSLGIELHGGVTEKIIIRNSPIPISVTREFTTYMDNQIFMKLHVLQGEREMVEDCRSLAEFQLKLPLMKAGGVRMEVTFSIDTDGILSVSALEKNSGVSHIVEVSPTYGLSKNEISSILENAYQNAINDHNRKLLQETITNAKSLIYNIENAIKEMPNLLVEEEMQKVDNAIKLLTEAISLNDRDYIIECSKNFENVTEYFIYERLNEAVEGLLKGKHIDQI